MFYSFCFVAFKPVTESANFIRGGVLFIKQQFIDINYLLGKVGCVFGSVGLSVCLWTTLLKKLYTDWDEILWRSPG